MMKFESWVLWEERSLLSEQENEEKGLLGFLRCYFTKDQKGFTRDLSEWKTKDREIKEETEALLRFLQTEDAFYILRSEVDMLNVCRDRMRDHVPYSFRRECWGFRVLTENRVWYLSCTPWNERKQFTVFGYDRKILMTLLASARGLPESCYGVYPFTSAFISGSAMANWKVFRSMVDIWHRTEPMPSDRTNRRAFQSVRWRQWRAVSFTVGKPRWQIFKTTMRRGIMSLPLWLRVRRKKEDKHGTGSNQTE